MLCTYQVGPVAWNRPRSPSPATTHHAISIQPLCRGHSRWCGRPLPRPRSAIRSTSVSGRSGYWGPFCCCFWLAAEAPFLATDPAPFF